MKNKFTVTEWAAICAINIEPNYRFVGNEKRIAQRMAAEGWIRPTQDNKYKVTQKGKRAYARVEGKPHLLELR